MTYDEFLKELKKNQLSVVEFSKLANTSKSTVYQWKKNNVPNIVESWLENYSYKIKYEKIKDTLKDS